MKTNKKFLAGISLVLSFVIVVTASFAWFTSKDGRINHFETRQITDGSVGILEVFDPPIDWKPGQEVLKNVSAVNNAETDALVRVSFEEILKLLRSGGSTVQSDTSDVSATHPDWMPVHVTTAGYTTGWTTLTDADTVAPIPDGLIIKSKSATDPASGKTVYTYFAYQDLGDDTFQKVTLDVAADNGKLALSNISYYFFDGKVTTYADWANENVVVPNGTPVVHPLAGSIDYTGTSPVGSIQADSLVLLKYGALTQAMTENNWWYNAQDGYFYYIGKLAAGEISPLLLETVTLDSSAGNEHALMELDLAVLLEAIQNTRDAIVASDGWGLTDTQLITALSAYCS